MIMATSDEKVRNVVLLLDKFDFGVRKYLDWISSVKQIDTKAHVKSENKNELDKWRNAFSEAARKTGFEVSHVKENVFDLRYLSFTISVRISNRAGIDHVTLTHPANQEAELDINELLKTPQDVPAVFVAFVDLMKSMMEASRDENSELSKIMTSLKSIYNDLNDNLTKPESSVSSEIVLSSRYGQVVAGKSCFLLPSFIYYCHPSQPLQSFENSKQLIDYRANITFLQSPSSFSLQVAHDHNSNVFTYASVSGVYLLVLEKPVLICFAIFRKLQDLCRCAGILHHLKSTLTNQSSLPSMREATPMFPRALLNGSGTERVMQVLPNHNMRLAIAIQWEKDLNPNVFDPCYWVEAIPFCDTKSLAHIVHLLRMQQRFNTLLLNSCCSSLPKDAERQQQSQSPLREQQHICLPLNITVNSLTSFTLKCRHPTEAKFLSTAVSLPRESDISFNDPKIMIQSLDLLMSENSEELQQTYIDSVVEVFRATWSLSALGAFIWQSFLPVPLNTSFLKEEKSFFPDVCGNNNNMPMSPSACSDGQQTTSQNSSASKGARRVSILEEILSEADVAILPATTNNVANANASNNNTAVTSSPSVEHNYSPSTQQRLLSSNSWLPNSANITSFEPPTVLANPVPVRATTTHGTRGRPRKSMSGLPPGIVPNASSNNTNSNNNTGSVRSPATGSSSSATSRKRLSLPPVSELAEQDAAMMSPALTKPVKPPQQGKRGRRVSTSPSTSSPAFSLQQSPAGSRHGNEFFASSQHHAGAGGNSEHHQSHTPMTMTPAFSFPSEYGGGEESEESGVQSTPSDEKMPPVIGAGEITYEQNNDDKDGGFPSPPILVQEHPRPASEEDEKGLVICEPGGYDTSPVFEDCQTSPPIPLVPPNRVPSSASLSRPSSSMSDHLRLPANHRMHQRVLVSSDESEQSSSNSLPEEHTPAGTKNEPSFGSQFSATGPTSRYNSGLSPGFASDQPRGMVPPPNLSVAASRSGQSSHNKPSGVKLLGFNDLFDISAPPGSESGGPGGSSTLSRNQQARAALDRVLMKNRQPDNPQEDAFAFTDRDPVPSAGDLKASGSRPAKRPAPNSSTTKPASKTSSGPGNAPSGSASSRQRTTSEDQRPKQPKQRKIEQDSSSGGGLFDALKKVEKARPENNGSSSKTTASGLSDFTRPLPAGVKIPKKTPSTTLTSGVAATGADNVTSKSQATPKNKAATSSQPSQPQQQQQQQQQQQATSQSQQQSASSAANPLGSFRIPKKKDTGPSETSSGGGGGSGSSSKRPGTLPITSGSSSGTSSKNPSSATSGGGSGGSFRQRTNSFDGSKEKTSGTPTTGISEPTPIPLSASYPQMQKQSSGGGSDQQQQQMRSLQHHKSQPEFPASSNAGPSIEPPIGETTSRRKSTTGPDQSGRPPGSSSASSSSSMRRSNHRSGNNGTSSSQQPLGSSRNSATGQRSSYGPENNNSNNSQAPRRQSAAVPASYTPTTPVVEAYVTSSNSSAASSSYPQPPPAHQRLPSTPSQNVSGSRSFVAHSSSALSYSADYSASFPTGAAAGGTGSSWYDNNSLGGSNYRSFFDQPSGEAPIQSPEPYGQPQFDSQPPVIIATSPVRQQPQSSHNNSNNYF